MNLSVLLVASCFVSGCFVLPWDLLQLQSGASSAAVTRLLGYSEKQLLIHLP